MAILVKHLLKRCNGLVFYLALKSGYLKILNNLISDDHEIT